MALKVKVIPLCRLALLIQKWDQEESTKGVAVGLELVNEPGQG